VTLQERLAADLKETMKSGDKVRLGTLRLAKAAVQNAEIAKRQPLDDADVIEILSKEARQRRESIAEYRNANRPDAAAKEETELAIIMEYLPQQMSQEEIQAIVQQVITETESVGPKDKGKVMSRLMPQVKGKADGQLVNQIVTQLLGN